MKQSIPSLALALIASGCPSSVPLDQDSAVGLDGAPAGETCAEIGATRTVACGNCGLMSEECGADGRWAPASACLSEGFCEPGAVESESLPMCSARQRICDDACQWREWTTTIDPGECDPGARQRVSTDTCREGLQPQVCTADCVWENAGGCTDACGGTGRASPEWAREVCIPAGPFIRGDVRFPNTRPVAEIELSAYYIDAYPVTNRRWRECVMAGGCSRPVSPGADSYADPERDDYPVQSVSWSMARAFCEWDGGRLLPTSAQWEKAARGPAPRDQSYVWDGDEYRCDLVPAMHCPEGLSDAEFAPNRYNELPGSVGYYGTYLQFGGVVEWVYDYWAASWYSDPDSTQPNTSGPDSGTSRVYRGVEWFNTRDPSSIAWWGGSLPDDGTLRAGVRCVRPAMPE